jgi:hypothetical protein
MNKYLVRIDSVVCTGLIVINASTETRMKDYVKDIWKNKWGHFSPVPWSQIEITKMDDTEGVVYDEEH